jgi:predicted outer membrane repeat protein
MFALLLLVATQARALDITVDVLGDPIPNGCTPGDCSLREAITLANSLAGPDRILLPATPGLPLQLSIPGASENANATGDLDVLDDLEIIGTGASTTVLVQTAADRVLNTVMAADKRLLVRGLSIQGGTSASGGGLMSSSLVTIEDVAFIGNEVTFEGGAIAYAAAFAPSITDYRLVLRRVRFENNVATQAADAFGGALNASSFLGGQPFVLIDDCDFDGNQAKSGGGAIRFSGAPNFFSGDIVILRSRFTANGSGGSGGAAILASSSFFQVQIHDSVFDGNVTTGSQSNAGGAINFNDIASAEVLRSTFASNSGLRGGALRSTKPIRIADSYFFDNTAAVGGGAVWGYGELLVERSTFESNRVTSTTVSDPGGGAIGFSGDIMGIQRSTFSANDAFRGGAISLESGRLQLYGSTLVTGAFGIAGRAGTVLRILDDSSANLLAIANSIFSGSCTFPSAGRQLAVAYNNIEAPGNSCRFSTAAVNAQNQLSASNAEIALAALADNGGPTQTRLPGAGSIAINQGRESYCSATDQRHFQRADAVCDIGAVEVGATPLTADIFRNGFE